MNSNDLSEKVEAIKQINELFKLERYLYISISVVSLLILLVAAGWGVYAKEVGAAEVTTMFGSAGGFTVATGRLLRMWNRAMSLLGAPEES
jgi:hypothetical protein